jgi:UDP-glucose:glycoprotein glucosyltransferase
MVSIDDGKNEILSDADGLVQVVVCKFGGSVLITLVKKRAGKEHEELLSENVDGSDYDSDHESSVWDTIRNSDIINRMFGSYRIAVSNATINVFSVASGHLYERFLRIMIVSVLRYTSSTVKFWFIEDFLSPVFKV